MFERPGCQRPPLDSALRTGTRVRTSPPSGTDDFLSLGTQLSPLLPQGQGSSWDISLWSVSTAETFPRKKPPAWPLVCWHELELFNLCGISGPQMTAAIPHMLPLPRRRDGESRCLPPPMPSPPFLFSSGSNALSSSVGNLACNSTINPYLLSAECGPEIVRRIIAAARAL